MAVLVLQMCSPRPKHMFVRGYVKTRIVPRCVTCLSHSLTEEVKKKIKSQPQFTFYIDEKAEFEVEELMDVASNHYKMHFGSGTWKSTKAI
jgi:hypothetical protein